MTWGLKRWDLTIQTGSNQIRWVEAWHHVWIWDLATPSTSVERYIFRRCSKPLEHGHRRFFPNSMIVEALLSAWEFEPNNPRQVLRSTYFAHHWPAKGADLHLHLHHHHPRPHPHHGHDRSINIQSVRGPVPQFHKKLDHTKPRTWCCKSMRAKHLFQKKYKIKCEPLTYPHQLSSISRKKDHS